MSSTAVLLAQLISSLCAGGPATASAEISITDEEVSVPASPRGLIATLQEAVDAIGTEHPLQRQINHFAKPSNGKEASSLTIATRLHNSIPKGMRPELKAGDEIIVDQSGIHHKTPYGKTLLLSFNNKDAETEITKRTESSPVLTPSTSKATSPLVVIDPGNKTLIRKFSFSPQNLRDSQNQKASYEDFRKDLQAAKDVGLTREQVARELFGDGQLNRMFTYSDGFANEKLKGVEAELRKSDNIRWQQIAAYYSVFGYDTKLTGECKPFEGFTTEEKKCLPDETKLRENHTDALDIFYTKASPNVYAVQGGVVVAASDTWGKPGGGLGEKSGNGVIIATPRFNQQGQYQGMAVTHYYHLEDLQIGENSVRKVGDIVNHGDLLGHGGITGTNATTSLPHLHCAIHIVTPEAQETKAKHVTVDCKDLFDLFDGQTTIGKIFTNR